MKSPEQEHLQTKISAGISRRTRFLCAMLVGLVMFFVTFAAVWYVQVPMLAMGHGMTRSIAVEMQEGVEKYTHREGHPPTTLADVPEIRERFGTRGDQMPDAWEHPFHLVQHGDSAEVVSYGRDGVPGGEGLDADISGLKNSNSSGQLMTLKQFFQNASIAGVVIDCLIPVIATGMIVYFAGSKSSKPTASAAMLLFGLIVAALSLMFGATLAALSVSGH